MRIHWLALVALAGCGASDDGTAKIDQFVQAVAAQECAWELRCCTDGEMLARDGRVFGDVTSCAPYRALTMAGQLYQARLAARQGRVRLDDAKAQACILSMEARPCSTLASAACADVFDGTTAVGDTCSYAAECVDGARCVMDPIISGAGLCVAYQKQDAICNGDSDCMPTMFCEPASATCQPRPPAKAAPTTTNVCAGRG